MEIILIQKMKVGKADSEVKCKETPPICTQFNLDIAKLEQQSLLCNPIYRRLYNIVKNDMTRSDLSFRKNLIKQLYFLLQITPVMRPQLRDLFLIQVEKMYNVNDHKKIDLASNKLNNLLNIVHSRKESGHSGVIERPKTGVTWNQNVSPFLRPYTASRQRDSKKQKNVRPQSSKFGDQSTKVQTLEDFYIKEFTTNIQEELQISRQFLEKHRTNHPEYEPIYEQLYNILKKIQTNVPQQPIKQKKKVPKGTRYVRSALVRNNKENWISPEPNLEQQHLKAQQQGIQSQGQQVKIKDNDQQSSEQEEYLYVNEKPKPANPYSQTIKIQQEVDKIEQLYSGNLRKYNHVIGNKLVQAVREDKQMAQKYVYYARVKTAMKREINRRNQSRRLMSAKHSNSSNVKMTRIIPQIQKENIQVGAAKVIDLTKDPMAIPVNNHKILPTYNKREFLNEIYEKQLRRFENHNNIQYIKPNEFKKPIMKRPLTSYTRFHSPVRFDPMSQQNVKKYNEQMLDEIEKIKMKVGGKCYASTESLMKALVVYEAPEKQLIPKWQDKNIFYGMMSQGKGKKLKKKGRKGVKLNKSIKK